MDIFGYFTVISRVLARKIVPLRGFPKLSIESFQNSTNNCILVWNLCYCKMAKNIWKSGKYWISKIMDLGWASATNMLANYPEEIEKICLLRGLQLPLPFMVTLVCIPFADYDNFPFFLKIWAHNSILHQKHMQKWLQRDFSQWYFPLKYLSQKYLP